VVGIDFCAQEAQAHLEDGSYNHANRILFSNLVACIFFIFSVFDEDLSNIRIAAETVMFSLPRISILVIVLALFPCKQVKEVIAEGSLELQGLRLEADLILHIRARNKT